MLLSLPLDGLKVVDLTTIIMGPFATQLLGDLGADIIKVETSNGDITRDIGISKSAKMASMYLAVNRNKRSINLNLKKQKSKEVLWSLIENADIFIHNMRPKKLRALGFSPEKVRKKNKKIIFVGLYGYGKDGTYHGMPAFDDIIQGQSGLASLYTIREGKPTFVPSVIADKNIGLLSISAILAAYIKCLKKGKGSCVEISMFEGMVSYVLLEHQHGEIFSPKEDKIGYPRLLSKRRKPYKTKDGYICILPYTDKQWLRFFDVINKSDLKKNRLFLDVKSRSKEIEKLYNVIEKSVIKKTTQELTILLSNNDIPFGKVNTLSELKNDSHLKKVEFFRKVRHPSEGDIIIPDTGIKIDSMSLPIRHTPPKLGEHSQEILSELGYNDKEIFEIINLNKTR